MKTIITILIFQLFLSCTSSKETDWMVIGYCCGECHDKCFSGYYIEKDSIYKISGKYCDDVDISNKIVTDNEEYAKVANVADKLPNNYTNFSGTYGCPDCHDQCSIFVSFKLNGNITKIILDPDLGMHPEEFNDFVNGILDMELM
jgi:hypothetical protein